MSEVTYRYAYQEAGWLVPAHMSDLRNIILLGLGAV